MRVWISAAVLLGGLTLLHGVSHGETITPHRPLEEFPMVLDGWQGHEVPLAERIVEAAGVDEYLNRYYVAPSGRMVALYVGYYGSQKTGDLIHSPKNCLPGAGWEPVRAGRQIIRRGDEPPVEVNEYLIEKGLDRRLVLYWYQGRGRIIASEYWGKVWQVVDAVTRRRTDAALVRLVTPVNTDPDQARKDLVEFARRSQEGLREFIPD